MYRNILIATDGSDLAQAGLEHGLALAAGLRARAAIVTVSEPMDPRIVRAAELTGDDDVREKYEDSVNSDLSDWFALMRGKAAELGVEVEVTGLIGASPAEAIVAHAAEAGCDLIVMSSHGRRGLKRLILGSQTAEVLAKSPIPVLVVRHQAAPEA